MNIRYAATALEQLEELSVAVRQRIVEKMYFYRTQDDPLAFGKRLSGYNVWRFRVGNYRVLCEVHNDTLSVVLIARRDEAYKDL